MAVYQDEAVVIKHLDFEETSRILTLCTKYHGKVAAIAKGVRRLHSRKAGSLEQFNQIRVFLAEGKNLDIVTEVEVLQSFHQLSQSLKAAALAYQMCELVDSLTPERQENTGIYKLLVTGLKAVRRGKSDFYQLKRCFQIKLLKLGGFWPETRLIPDQEVQSLVDQIIGEPLGQEIEVGNLKDNLWERLDGVISEYLGQVLSNQLRTDKVYSKLA
jgi:DNA repair protein RecO (recombination protein O)